MKFLAVLALLPFVLAQSEGEVVTGKLGDAARITDNPTNVTYAAHFKDESKVHGTILFHPGPNGEGAHLAISLSNFPVGEGPFTYHIHDQPVPSDGNCTGTKAHLDPYQRGQTPPCDATKPETCEVGDLSGKHGKIAENATSYSTDYVDAFLSLKSPSGAYIGNRSVVIHNAATNRIACVNITAEGAHGDDDGHHAPNATHTASEPPVPTKTPSPGEDDDDAGNGDNESSAGKVAVSVFAVAVGAAAALML